MVDIDSIIRFENGEMNDAEVAALFANLVATGAAWTMQGAYGRMAQRLLDDGIIDRFGHVLVESLR